MKMTKAEMLDRNKEDIIEMYNNLHTQVEIAKKYGVSYPLIKQALDRWGVPTRARTGAYKKGQEIGYLTILEMRPNGKYLVECRCGKEFTVNNGRLTAIGKEGRTNTSCGCHIGIEKEALMVGEVFNMLTVTERVGSSNGKVYWKALCECGNNTVLTTADLRGSRRTSCGCLISKGEKKVMSILQEHSIKFEVQYRDDKLRNPKTGSMLFIDFVIYDENGEIDYFIEYDGEQHFTGWNNCKDDLKSIQYRDNIKNEYCKNLNKRLIRISYKDYNKLNIDMLK